MDMEIFTGLVHNTALLLILGVILELTHHMKEIKYGLNRVFTGILIGAIGVGIMMMPFQLSYGVFFDTRTILLGVSGLIFGTIPSVVAAGILSGYRIFLGGSGVYMGVATIITSTVIGLLWKKYLLNKYQKNKNLNIYLFGVVVHLNMILCAFLLLPSPENMKFLTDFTLPVILIYPLGTVCLSMLLLRQQMWQASMLELIGVHGRYKGLFENNNAIMYFLDPINGNIIEANYAASKFYGWPLDVMKTMNISQINTLPYKQIKEKVEQAAAENLSYVDFKHRKASGEIVDVEVNSVPIEVNGKSIVYTIVNDASKRAAADKALNESENRFQSLVDNAPDAIYIRVGDKITYVNKQTMKLYGASEESQLLGTSVYDRYHPDCLDVVKGRIQATDRGAEIPPMEQIHLRLDGTPVHAEATAVQVEYQGQRASVVFVRDITERAAAKLALEASEARFRSLVDNAPEAIYIRNGNKIVYVNKAAVSLYGATDKEQLLGTDVNERFHPDSVGLINSRIKVYETYSTALPPVEMKHLKLDGTPVEVEVTGVPIEYEGQRSMVIFLRDITEKKQLKKQRLEMEAQMRQQQKLEAIGTLASGVAHEINNPINGIMNYAQLILDAQQKGSESEKFADEIIRETERVSQIVKNLLQFSRQEKQSHSYASVYDIVNRTVSLISTLIRKDAIALEIDMEEELPNIKCRSQQIEQVLMNLLTNARDALNDKYPGSNEDKVIKLGCSQFHRDGRRWVRLTIEDHGGGVPEEMREKIFEPFFSTKPRDKGTGLGLSISFGIVKDHHGYMWIEAEEGKYTRFHVDLPVDNGWEI